MLRVGATARIDAPPQRVWDLYADVPGSVDWVPFAEAILEVRGEPGLGQIYRERTRLLGVTGEQTWEIVRWDPPRQQVQRSTDLGMDSRLSITLTPDGRGTLVRQATELRSPLPPPLGWLHEALFALVARYGNGRAVAAAKRHLEGGEAG